jgi:hypothetical protein
MIVGFREQMFIEVRNTAKKLHIPFRCMRQLVVNIHDKFADEPVPELAYVQSISRLFATQPAACPLLPSQWILLPLALNIFHNVNSELLVIQIVLHNINICYTNYLSLLFASRLPRWRQLNRHCMNDTCY